MTNEIQHPSSFKYDDDDLEEVETSLKGEDNEVNFGEIEPWEPLVISEKVVQTFEKIKVRPYITGITMSLWTICTCVCLVKFVITGHFVEIGPPALLMVPVYVILKFYYKSD